MREIRLARKAVKFLENLPIDYRNTIKQRIKILESELTPYHSIQLKGRE